MIDREKVIKGLEWCMNEKHDCYREKGCPYENEGEDIGCKYALHRDALAMLKEQGPRVMKVGEVCNWVNSDRVTREPVFIEMRSGICAWIIDDEVREIPGAENLTSGLYSKTWRCWTSRPTDEQREATPWE